MKLLVMIVVPAASEGDKILYRLAYDSDQIVQQQRKESLFVQGHLVIDQQLFVVEGMIIKKDLKPRWHSCIFGWMANQSWLMPLLVTTWWSVAD